MRFCVWPVHAPAEAAAAGEAAEATEAVAAVAASRNTDGGAASWGLVEEGGSWLV